MLNPNLRDRRAVYKRERPRAATSPPSVDAWARCMARVHLARQLRLGDARGQRHIRLSVAMLRAAVADQRTAAMRERDQHATAATAARQRNRPDAA